MKNKKNISKNRRNWFIVMLVSLVFFIPIFMYGSGPDTSFITGQDTLPDTFTIISTVIGVVLLLFACVMFYFVNGFCPHCGTFFSRKIFVTYCPKCGKRVDEADSLSNN